MTEHHQIQAALVEWYDMRFGDGLLISIPNAGKRSVVSGALLKAEGMRPGVWDLFLAVPRHSCHGLWMEIKLPEQRTRARGGLTIEQEKFCKAVRSQFYSAQIAYTTQEGIEIINWYLK